MTKQPKPTANSRRAITGAGRFSLAGHRQCSALWCAARTVQLRVLVVVLLGLAPGQQLAFAWHQHAHAAVGVLSLEQVQPATRRRLETLIGSTDPWAIAYACHWPDEYDQRAEGRWSSPLHYVNLAPDADRYRQSRDCPDRQCVPEAVIHYASELGSEGLDQQQQWQAFAFVCHLVADLHQPLHVAFADDRGGSLVTVNYKGQGINLHQWWDGQAFTGHADDWQGLAELLRERPQQQRPGQWVPNDVYGWTNETFSFTRNFAYPQQREINERFAARSWLVIAQQLDVAAGRLASLLDARLGGDIALPEVSADQTPRPTNPEPPETPTEEP